MNIKQLIKKTKQDMAKIEKFFDNAGIPEQKFKPRLKTKVLKISSKDKQNPKYN